MPGGRSARASSSCRPPARSSCPVRSATPGGGRCLSGPCPRCAGNGAGTSNRRSARRGGEPRRAQESVTDRKVPGGTHYRAARTARPARRSSAATPSGRQAKATTLAQVMTVASSTCPARAERSRSASQSMDARESMGVGSEPGRATARRAGRWRGYRARWRA